MLSFIKKFICNAHAASSNEQEETTMLYKPTYMSFAAMEPAPVQTFAVQVATPEPTPVRSRITYTSLESLEQPETTIYPNSYVRYPTAVKIENQIPQDSLMSRMSSFICKYTSKVMPEKKTKKKKNKVDTNLYSLLGYEDPRQNAAKSKEQKWIPLKPAAKKPVGRQEYAKRSSYATPISLSFNYQGCYGTKNHLYQ